MTDRAPTRAAAGDRQAWVVRKVTAARGHRTGGGVRETFGGQVAASRGAVEAGLAPRALQVGQTGTTVQPRLYVACGISGALQHAVGMRTARTVLAINRDPDAFIFHLAHYGIVADVRDALPQLIAAMRRAKA